MKAIDLFGGEARVLQAMTEAVQKHGRQQPIASLLGIEAACRLEPGTLTDVVLQGGQVNYRLFDKVSAPLGLSIHIILGKPALDEQSTRVWEREMELSPLYLVGRLDEDPEAARLPKNQLGMYVTLRAIEELNADAPTDDPTHSCTGEPARVPTR